MNWEGNSCVVIASGPSLTDSDIELVRKSGINTIAVNTTWEKVRFCKAIYAGDTVWWKYNHKKIDIDVERWSCARNAQTLYGCKYRARHVKPGYNSGANAIELAVNQLKCSSIIMLGFDCSVKNGTHHHENHKHTSNPTSDRTERWKPQFKTLRDKVNGTPVYNCSRYTEIKYFPVMDLEQALNECLPAP